MASKNEMHKKQKNKMDETHMDDNALGLHPEQDVELDNTDCSTPTTSEQNDIYIHIYQPHS